MKKSIKKRDPASNNNSTSSGEVFFFQLFLLYFFYSNLWCFIKRVTFTEYNKKQPTKYSQCPPRQSDSMASLQCFANHAPSMAQVHFTVRKTSKLVSSSAQKILNMNKNVRFSIEVKGWEKLINLENRVVFIIAKKLYIILMI